MFYAHFVLSKKGPLARIWLAAHWDKKLTKAHVFETNIEGSVEAIIQPKVKLALRTSGHLLLGVVRIYSRKAKYLLADCNEAFVKIKMAFRPGVVDLPEENREAAVASITMPETFHDFDTAMADLNDLDVQAQFAVNQSRPEEITMREDLANITLVGDDGFGDMGFESGANIIQDAHMDDTLYVRNEEAGNLLLDTSGDKNQGDKPMDIDLQAQPRDDGFGDGIPDFEGPAGCDDDDDSDNGADFGGVVDDDFFGDTFVGEGGGLFEEPPVPEVPQEPPQVKDTTVTDRLGPEDEQGTTVLPEQTTVVPDQTTLIPNEAEAFALEPIDVTTLGTERKAKRKRKLVIDDQKGIPSETMKLQLSDTSDITTTLDLAPPTKKLKYWKETGGVEKLFALPGRPMVSKRVSKMFNRNLVTCPMLHGAEDHLDLQQQQPEEEPELPAPVLEPVQPEIPTQLHDTTQEIVREEQSISAMEMPSMAMPEPEQPSLVESSLMEPQPLDTNLPAPELEQPSLTAESFILQQSAALDSLVEPHTPLTRSRLQQQQHPEEEDEDVDDIFGQDLPPVEGEPEAQDENGPDAEELEEQRWSRRTQQMMHVINKHLKTRPTASFKDMTIRNNRKQVASKFYTLLVLKKMQAIEVEQSQPYGDIAIIQGPKMGLVF